MVRPPGHSLGDGANLTRRGKRNRNDPAIQGKGVHWSSPAVTHGVSRGPLCRRVSPITACPGEGRITEPAAAAQAWPLEPVFISQCRHRGSGPGGGSNGHTHTLGGPPSITRRSGWVGRERHVVVHYRLAEVLVASVPTCSVGMLPLESGVDIAVAAAEPDYAIVGGCAKAAQASCRQHETR